MPSTSSAFIDTVFLHVTKACNLRCAYCYFSASEPLPDEMTSDELTRVWAGIVSVRPLKVVFTGGEPLLRSDIFELLSGLREVDRGHDIVRCLNTNGHLVTPSLARDLVGLVDEVRVSIDGLTERNDKLRGHGSFAAALQALEWLHAVGFEPKALITVTAVTAPDLTELLCLLFSKNITRINLNGFRPIGRGAGHHDWTPVPDDVRSAVLRAWARYYPDDPPPRDPLRQAGCINCGVGSFLNIMPNGDVFPCHVLTQPEFRCGNLRRQSLADICAQNGLVGQLSRLDFAKLADRNHALGELRSISCMGNTYRATRSLAVWREHLPSLGMEATDSFSLRNSGTRLPEIAIEDR
jgi:MoaA/NifB/PqqE/SkfB family radical SAM enzyme